MKKVVCPNCSHLIEIEDNKDGDVFCSSCGINFILEDGIKALAREIKLNKNKGYREYLKLNFEASNEYYYEVLKLDPNDLDVLGKVILNYQYLNTFLESHYEKVKEVFETADIVLNDTNTYLFLSFLRDYVHNIGVYINEVNTRLFKDDKLINEKYVAPFYKALKDINDSFPYLDEIFPLLKEESKNVYLEDNPKLMKNYEDKKELINKLLNSSFLVLKKGEVKFNLENFSYNEEIKVEGEPILLEEERIIVPDNNFKKKLKIFYITVGLSLGVAAIFLILGFSTKLDVFYYLSLIPAGLLGIFLIVYYKKMRS